MFQEIGDVLAGEGLEGEGILDRPADLILVVDLTEGDDLLHVVAWIHAAFIELPVVVRGPGGEREKAQEEALVPGFLALSEKWLGVVRVFTVLMSVEASGVTGDELVFMIDADSVGISLESETVAGVLSGHRVAVGVEGHAKLGGGPHLDQVCDIEGVGRQG